MCGILGGVNVAIENDWLGLLQHRGPDDQGIARMPAGQHQIVLGHRRLAIVDLSPAGHQPMPCRDESEWIVFNGEIYNHRDLRKQLGDVSYRGHSDTETLLQGLSRRGRRILPELNGIFAFAYLNRKTQKLLLARDPFGVKPLYYWHSGNSLIFASELLPIAKLVRDSVDPSKLAEVLRLRYAPAPDTLFRSIRKVRPGHVLEIDLGARELRLQETSFLASRPPQSPLSFRDACEHYGQLLEQAVRRQLMSDVEVGVLLSGGIDSALVAQFARQGNPTRLKAFTVGFTDGGDADEMEDARESAAILGLEHHEVRIGFDEFFDSLRRCISIVEEPLATTSIIPMDHLAALAARHVKVVLSGQGADEALGGYARYQSELVRGFLPAAAARMLKTVSGAFGINHGAWNRGLRSLSCPDDLERFRETYTVFDPRQIRTLIGVEDALSKERIAYFFDLLECRSRHRSVERMMSIDLRMNLADDLLLYTDKITMRHSLECRVPMLDHELVTFVESLPARYRLRLGKGKWIHRQFAQRVLPARIVHRKRKGFFSPTEKWFRRKGILADILLNQGSRFSRFFDLSEVSRMISRHGQGCNLEREIFLLLGLHFWLEEFA